jgi:Membrane-associated sensor, integral membrane domain
MRQAPDEYPFLLATLQPSQGEKRAALGAVVALLVAFGLVAPFAHVQLPRVDAFIPAFETAIVSNDLIAAALLFGQFLIVRWISLLVLANGFLFTGLIVIPHALTFPGAFAPAGTLGAGLQSAAWLYYFWHAGAAFAVIGYVSLANRDNRLSLSSRSPAVLIGWSIALMICVVCALT